MPQYFSLLTLNGQGKVADAIAGDTAVNITHLAVGDGNGAPVTPLETQTQLVHEVWRGAVTGVARDPLHPTQVIVTAEIPVEAGPFVVREMGLIAGDGSLFAVQNTPEIEKSTGAQGATQDVIVKFRIVVATTANITVTVDPASLVHVGGLMRAPFIAIDQFAGAPPVDPEAGALVVVAADAAGAFVGLDHKFAQWTGDLWVNAVAVEGTIVADASTGLYWRRTDTGWDEITELNYGLVKRKIETTGLVYAPAADNKLLAKASSLYASFGRSLVCTGPANTYAVAPHGAFEVPLSFLNGQIIEFIPTATNTGAATVNGVDVLLFDGSALPAGAIVGGRPTSAIYSTTAAALLLLPWCNGKLDSTGYGVAVPGIVATFSKSVAHNVETKLSDGFTVVSNQLGDSTFSGGEITVGAKDAGIWAVTVNPGISLAGASLRAQMFMGGVLASNQMTPGSPPYGSAVTNAAVLPVAAGTKIYTNVNQQTGSTQTFVGRISAFRMPAFFIT